MVGGFGCRGVSAVSHFLLLTPSVFRVADAAVSGFLRLIARFLSGISGRAAFSRFRLAAGVRRNTLFASASFSYRI